MDVVGNDVNEYGESINHLGKKVEIKDYFVSNNQLSENAQRNFEYTKILGEQIVKGYFKFNTALSSHVLSFTAFELLKHKHHNLDLYGVLRLPLEDTQIDYSAFTIALEKVRSRLIELKKQGKIQLSYEVELPTEKLIKHGLSNIGLYHSKRVLFVDSNGNYNTDDMKLLFFYHNRLEGYQLEKYI